MPGYHLITLATPAFGRRIAACIGAVAVLLLALGGICFRLLVPIDAAGEPERPLPAHRPGLTGAATRNANSP